VSFDNADFPDLLTGISNGLGSTSTIKYSPSSAYTNTLLPFPVQTVQEMTTYDGNGVVATTRYDYAGGYYHLGDRDFRGFNYVKVTGPPGRNGERAITETWFHQGNDTAVNANNPNVPVGYTKGKPYRIRASNGLGQLLSETLTAYVADTTAPYFNPPFQVDSSICDAGICGKSTRSVFVYDPTYGNVLEERHSGDLADPSDDLTSCPPFRTESHQMDRELTHQGKSASRYRPCGSSHEDDGFLVRRCQRL
jgi:hypothetical protein